MKGYVVREEGSTRDFMTMAEDDVQAAVNAVLHGPFGLEYDQDLTVWDWEANRSVVTFAQRRERIMPPQQSTVVDEVPSEFTEADMRRIQERVRDAQTPPDAPATETA